MLTPFVDAGSKGKPVFVTDVRNALLARCSGEITGVLVLPDGNSIKRFDIPLPSLTERAPQEVELLFAYVRAEVYNHLTTLGGYSLTLYLDTGDGDLVILVSRVINEFQIARTRAERTGYARIVNVLDRMNDALHPTRPDYERRFSIEVRDRSELPPAIESIAFRAEATDTFHAVTTGLDGTIVCGLDIGGTDIKGALAVNGELVALKEYDWNPATYEDVELIVNPIVVIADLLRARAAIDPGTPSETAGATTHDAEDALAAKVEAALRPEATYEEMASTVALASQVLGDRMPRYDAIGLCFPDVVVQNRVVGGEVPKTRGMRGNRSRDFEEQFAELSRLNVALHELCRDGGVVMNTNDGPMAAFTAAVEIAHSPTPGLGRNGVFAHTLGTDLGTGLALANGAIPEIPLEVYNLVLDLGSDAARGLPADDLRSLANTNTGIAGTPQKLASQAGAFRLADSLIASARPELMEEIERRGFVVSRSEGSRTLRVVPEEPVDQRKPYLAYLMELASGEAEAASPAAEVFRVIGEYMAVVYEETEHILQTGLVQRFLFGRFVKVARVFELMQEGARRRSSELTLVAADSDMAYTPLMRALDADPHYTVAQFGQAVGAVYFGNLGLVDPALAR